MSKKRRITDEEMDALCDYLESDQDWYEAAKVLMDDEDLYSEYLYMCASKIAFHLENESISHEVLDGILKLLNDSTNKPARDAIWSAVLGRPFQDHGWLEVSDAMIQGLKLNQGLRTQSKAAQVRRSELSNERQRDIWKLMKPWCDDFFAKNGRPAYFVSEDGSIQLGRDFVEFCKPRFFAIGRPPVSDKTIVKIITKFHS